MKKEHHKIVLVAQTEMNIIEMLISKSLIDSNICYDEFILVDNALK